MKNIQQPKLGLPPTSSIQLPGWMRSRHGWMLSVGCWMLDVPRFVLIGFIRLYQLTLSPLQTYFIGGNGGCRFTPSCSAYAVDALREHGAVGGTFLAAKRICRCHPWGGCGHDPVPPKVEI